MPAAGRWNPRRLARRALARVADRPAIRAPRNRLEAMRRVPWPTDAAASSPTGDRVAIIVANYQTRALISQLVFSLCRFLGADQFACLVVVDNASTDGSVTTLEALRDAGLLHLIANRHQRYHGPALNQALSWLARRQSEVAPADRIDYVWVVDSDVVVLRADTVSGAVAAIREQGAAIVGQRLPGTETVPLASMLVDPRQVWTRGVAPFHDDGAPSEALQRSLLARGAAIGNFSFGLGSHVLHLGSGTLREIVAEEDHANRFYGWAQKLGDVAYSRHPLGPWLHRAFLDLYAAEVHDESPATLVAACRTPGLLTIPEAQPLPPLEELRDLAEAGVDLEAHLLERVRR
jgi:hypothetical protein